MGGNGLRSFPRKFGLRVSFNGWQKASLLRGQLPRSLCQRGAVEVLSNYLPILIFLVIATALAIVMLVLGSGLGRYFSRFHDDKAKRSPYECGFEAFEDSRMKFDVRYYLVAILFIVFDLEIAFLFPWAVALGKIGGFGLIAMAVFLTILVVGFVYEWKKGALEWD
jgi:NADH-quinone oxidoreductase subunit A